MKIRRRDFWKPMLGLGAVVQGTGHIALAEEVDPEDCILVINVHDNLSERGRARIWDSLREWKKDYPQLEDLPILVVDNGMDIKIIRRKGTSKI